MIISKLKGPQLIAEIESLLTEIRSGLDTLMITTDKLNRDSAIMRTHVLRLKEENHELLAAEGKQ